MEPDIVAAASTTGEVADSGHWAYRGRGRQDAKAFRADIQGLRAVAVALVVAYHARVPYLTGGFIGVDVFFVISGYLITGLLFRELASAGTINFPAFYARRIRRLLPAATVVIVATVIASHLLASPLEQTAWWHSAFYSALYVSNFWFASNATDYLTDVHTDPFLHMWSLSVEEQFYLVWPLLVVAGAGLTRALKRKWCLRAVLGSVLIASLAYCIFATSASPSWAFFGLPSRAWEFAVGGIAALAGSRIGDWPRGTRRVLAGAGLLAIAAGAVAFDGRTAFPGTAAMLPVGGAVLVLLFGTGASRVSLLGNRISQYVGDLSYSWYLWHWPVLILANPVTRPLDLNERLLLSGVAFLLAALTFHFVENPIRSNPRLKRLPWRSIVIGGLLTMVSAGSAVALRFVSEIARNSPDQALLREVRLNRSQIYADKCHQGYAGSSLLSCTYGTANARATMMLFGDSHAAHWFPALERIALDKGWRLVALTKSACPSARVRIVGGDMHRDYAECTTWRENVLARIRSERPALVVMANSNSYLGRREFGVDDTDWSRGMHETIAAIREAGSAVVLIRDTPRPGFDVPNCLSRAAWLEQSLLECGFDRSNTDQRVYAIDRAAAAGFDGVEFVDATSLICPMERCEAVRDGVVTYSDHHHLSPAFSTRLAKGLAERLGPVMDTALEGSGAKK